MKCSSAKFSPCRGTPKKYKLIEKYLMDTMIAKPDDESFNMEEIKRIAKEEIWFCDKHHEQHNAILEVCISCPRMLRKISDTESIETIK